MQDPKCVMIGAGALGGSMAAALLRAGADLSIIDTDADHVAAINSDGLRVLGMGDETPVHVAARTEPDEAEAFDLAIVMVPTYERDAAARTAAHVLKADGAAVSLQNGLGNAEVLIQALGRERVFMGSSRASADRPAPGQPRITKLDPLTLGEFSGVPRPRTRWLAEALTSGGFPTELTRNIEGVLWSKFITNCCINAMSAITGLRMGEVSRTPGLGPMRWQIVEECMRVVAAKGIELPDPDPGSILKPHTWRKFTKPSMLQMMDASRPIEIEALNAHLVREARALGIDVPLNRALTALARGRNAAILRDAAEPPDYAALTAAANEEIYRGETPWDTVEDDL
ncbi:MAG: ketopantoate reductase family protein [Pseudomonadota bacterium]